MFWALARAQQRRPRDSRLGHIKRRASSGKTRAVMWFLTRLRRSAAITARPMPCSIQPTSSPSSVSTRPVRRIQRLRSAIAEQEVAREPVACRALAALLVLAVRIPVRAARRPKAEVRLLRVAAARAGSAAKHRGPDCPRSPSGCFLVLGTSVATRTLILGLARESSNRVRFAVRSVASLNRTSNGQGTVGLHQFGHRLVTARAHDQLFR